jgi:hypothetical protein
MARKLKQPLMQAHSHRASVSHWGHKGEGALDLDVQAGKKEVFLI